MSYNNLLWEQEGGVATVYFNRPKAMNALNQETLDELEEVIKRAANESSISVLILTGTGGKAFVGGADIGELRALEGSVAGVTLCRRAQNIAASLAELSKPVIAVINGFALGGGLEVALACDIRLAADTALVGLPEISLGIIPGNGGTQRLARLVGKGMAKYLIFTGSHITAQEALELGIVEKVYPAEELLPQAKKLASKLAKSAPVALAMGKRAINIGFDTDLASGCAIEAHLFGIVVGTEDAQEGTSAFIDKRQPQFKGR